MQAKRIARYLVTIALVCVPGLLGIEAAVRKMPNAFCKAQVGDINGCSQVRSLERTLGEDTNRIYLGDSHVEYLADYKGFRDYSMPAMLPIEMLAVMQHLLKTRDMQYVIIGLAAHHLQDKATTREFDVLPPHTLTRQKLPFPVFALEPSLTVGLKRYIWASLFNQPLPVINGVQTVVDADAAGQLRARQKKGRAANGITRTSQLWWQDTPLEIDPHLWNEFNQARREKRALGRFRFFYPHKDYKNIDEHKALVALLELLQEHQIDACFVRFPHSKEFNALTQVPKYSLYATVQSYIRSMVESRGFTYLDTASLNLDLKSLHFRDSDHLLIPIIEDLTPVIVESCYPQLKD